MPAVTRVAGWKYKEGVTDEQKRVNKEGLLRVYAELAHLVNHGPIGLYHRLICVEGVELNLGCDTGGKNISKMGLDKGFDLVFTVEFKVCLSFKTCHALDGN